ncbi:MAG: hypothetical protein SOZ32_06895 [Bacilli bacterium]|nr:PTS transporter subunit EIIB [Mollicutes bacterium]MDY3899909.1 hypothetical protein [Bacilli bacterium]
MYNFGYILEGTSPVILPLVIALILMIVPIGVLLIIAVVKFIIKNAKRNHKSVESDEDIKNKYLALFGEENIISISSNMNRVTVDVADINKVNFDGLRNLGVGVLISGNTIKCSSAKFASIFATKE